MRNAAVGAAATLLSVSGVVASTGSAHAATGCPVKEFDYSGTYACGTQILGADWDENGTKDEFFVVSPARHIYHVWKNAGGWKEMPAGGRADNTYGYLAWNGLQRCVIVTVNATPRYYQNCFYSGSWHNWTIAGG